MKVYVPPTKQGLGRAINDIHHKTQDGGLGFRKAIAKAQRKAARRYNKIKIQRGILEYEHEIAGSY